ncbi:MAG: bacterial transcriptional activator domain-containing protein [Rubrobacteraceae bacterium]
MPWRGAQAASREHHEPALAGSRREERAQQPPPRDPLRPKSVELYAGDLLPEDRYETWAEERRGELRTTHLALFVELATLHEEREEFPPAISALHRLVEAEPTHEEASLRLMRLYAEPEAETKHLREEIEAGRFPEERLRPETRATVTGRYVPGRHNLPNARASFVGREREMVEVKRPLAMTGLLTLTGTGGCGKTRLALEVACVEPRAALRGRAGAVRAALGVRRGLFAGGGGGGGVLGRGRRAG